MFQVLFNKISRDNRGTALLVALLVMGVLISISLALSTLILAESRATKELVDSGKAYYAAESAIEEALYNLDNNLPGWEGEKVNLGNVGEKEVFKYVVKNKCNAYPCFDLDEYVLGTFAAYNFYGILELNENITIPLFTVENDEIVPVEDFTVEFFVNFDPANDLDVGLGSISGWDVLRWKVFGLRKVGDEYVTDAIHDFTAVSSVKNSKGIDDDFLTNANNPSWFGSKKCELGVEGIKCLEYAVSNTLDQKIDCWNTEARDYYLYSGEKFIEKVDCFSIGQFLDMHDATGDSTGLNYLSLTNLMNPDMLKESVYPSELGRRDASKIYFRVETYTQNTVREFANITADGFSGDAKQSISVDIKRDSYMPVFNFSLYSTYKSADEIDGTPTGFYQDVNLPQ